MSSKITIITISYNNREGLEKTIKSVTSQSYVDFEYIIIDGGSQDGSKEVITNFADKISYWVSESDKGIYNAMNKGIKAANGEYLLFLNSGDEFFANDVLEKALPYLHTEDLILFDIAQRFENNELSIYHYPKKLQFSNFWKGAIGHPTTFIKKNLFETYGLYDENFKIVSDWKFFLHVLINNATYRKEDIVLSIFSMDGISSLNNELVSLEKNKIFENHYSFLINDYQHFDFLKQYEKDSYKLNKIRRSRIFKLLVKLGFFRYID